MSRVSFVLTLACLLILGGLSPSASADPPRSADDRSLLARARDGASGATAVVREPATGTVEFLRSTADDGDLLPGTAARDAASARAKAEAFLDDFAPVFGAPSSQLEQAAVAGHDDGWTITYAQRYRGLPVFGAALKANVDADGDLTSVNGLLVPDLDRSAALTTEPVIARAEAGRRAVGEVRADPPGGKRTDTAGIQAAEAELTVYREGLVRRAAGETRLVWAVEVSNEANVRDRVFVDAASGKLVNRYSLVHTGLERHLYEAAYTPATKVWSEGDPFPGVLNPWQASEVTVAGEVYGMFLNTFDRDSWDGDGHVMETVNNDPRIACPNANWNGVTTNYCDGTATDDVVAHEWGHAYTEGNGDLIYQWQPGALNESYSDVWGETLDLINARDDTEEDVSTRSVGDCSTRTPSGPILEITAPSSIAKRCPAGPALFGPQLEGAGISGEVVLSTSATGDTSGCTPPANDVAGKIVLSQSTGTCDATVRVKNAQEAGATGALLADIWDYPLPLPPMWGDDPSITIPSLRIMGSDGTLMRETLGQGTAVSATMRDKSPVRSESSRWLMGEDATAFDGAIRDMWNPTCYDMPGKVSDVEYYCADGDQGGVHTNSGVPNHTYALLADGGTYNDVEVTGIGLDKAANIWWRAQTDYQVPSTDFPAHADNLTAACDALTGQDVNELSLDGADQGTVRIEADDCAQLAAAITATELREEPEACHFEPMFAPGDPAPCGEGFVTDTVMTEDFEDGLDGWATDQQVVNDGASGIPWTTTDTAPGAHRSAAAYGPTPNGGSCAGDADDLSSTDAIISPVIRMPWSTMRPILTFDHYVATEFGYDGGVLSVSVNGKKAEPVPQELYEFNSPRQLRPRDNTNPLSGAISFTGTDGGKVLGSWGTSVVNLWRLGVQPGDRIRLRFDASRDGCGGIDGWYVDDVRVTVCKVATRVRATHRPEPSRFGKASRVVVRVGRDGTGGERPDGKVLLQRRDRVLARGWLEDGRVVLRLGGRALKVGRHQTTVSYLGYGNFGPSRTKLRIRVRR